MFILDPITPDPTKSKNFVYVSDTAPSSPFHNQLWYDTSNDTLSVYDEPNNRWVALSSGDSGLGDIGVFGGGYDGSSHFNTIDYITISTPSDATDFGDLTVIRRALSATSNGINDRGVFGGGANGSSHFNTIDYITISTPSDATDFGDLTVVRRGLSATSNGTNDRGVFGGGSNGSVHCMNTIDYITISTPSDATDFGDLTQCVRTGCATSNGTNDRGVFGETYLYLNNSGTIVNVISYITIPTPSNATDFGDLTIARSALSATSNGTNDRGVFGGGYNDSSRFNTIDYITISTPSDATDFGDLTVARSNLSATSNGTNDRGVFGGGRNGSSHFNTIDYITIPTPSNATDFGDLTVKRYGLSATSNA